MPEFVFDMIVALTGETGMLPDITSKGIEYTAGTLEGEAALERFYDRPTLLTIYEVFTQRYGTWNREIDLSPSPVSE